MIHLKKFPYLELTLVTLTTFLSYPSFAGVQQAIIAVEAIRSKLPAQQYSTTIEGKNAQISIENRQQAIQMEQEPVIADPALNTGGLDLGGGPSVENFPRVKIFDFSVSGGSGHTSSRNVVLFHYATNNPTHYRVGENSNLTQVQWRTYIPNPAYTLSPGEGVKDVFFEIRGPDLPSPLMPGLTIANVSRAHGEINYNIPDARFEGHSVYLLDETAQVVTTGELTITLNNFDFANDGVGSITETVRWAHTETPIRNEACAEGGYRNITIRESSLLNNTSEVTWQKVGATSVVIGDRLIDLSDSTMTLEFPHAVFPIPWDEEVAGPCTTSSLSPDRILLQLVCPICVIGIETDYDAETIDIMEAAAILATVRWELTRLY